MKINEISVTDQKNSPKEVHICFIVDHVLQHYRIPLFRYLVKQGYNLTICYPSWFKRQSPTLEELDPELSKSVQAIPLNARKIFGFYHFGVKKLNQYDMVICMQDLRVIDFWKATLNPFKFYKIIHWGIGVSSFDKKNWLTIALRNFSAQFADRLILYSEEAKKYYSKNIRSKIAVAPNTVANKQSEDFSGFEKDCFLFIGQLSRRKGLTELIHSFSNYLKHAGDFDIKKLVIIGDGEMMDELKQLAIKLNIKDYVALEGSIKEDGRKRGYFKKAQLCISMNQAGLAVLESFSYGVPFVTSGKAITGGERFNIQHKKTGFFVESEQELTDLMHTAQKNPEEIKKIGSNAYRFYHEERCMDRMAGVFDEVIYEVNN